MVGTRVIYSCLIVLLIITIGALKLELFDAEFNLPDDKITYRGATPPAVTQPPAQYERFPAFTAHIVEEQRFNDSNYIANNRSHFLELSEAGTADLMLTPCYVFKEDAWAFDWRERLLIAAQFYNAIARKSSMKILDPMLVGRALGEGRRSISQNEIGRFASSVRVPSYLTCKIGHNFGWTIEGDIQNRTFSIEVSLFAFNKASGEYEEVGKSRKERLPFRDSELPYTVIKPHVDEITTELSLNVNPLSEAPNEKSELAQNLAAQDTALPASLAVLKEYDDKRNPLHGALVSALVPPLNDNGVSRLSVPSLLAAEDLPDKYRYKKLLVARALKELGRREAALNILSGDSSPEGAALKAFLNGNLPALESNYEAIEPGIPRILALIDLLDVQTAYQIPSGQRQHLITEIAALDTQLSGLIEQRLESLDPWRLMNSMTMKATLDATFPVEGESLPELLEQKMVLNNTNFNPFEFELATLRHVALVRSQDKSAWCCRDATNLISKRGIADLFEAIAEQAIFKTLEKTVTYQGSPSRAEKLLDAMGEYFQGHPEASRLTAATLISLANAEKDQRRQQLLNLAGDEILNAVMWSDGQTYAAAEALQLATWTKGLPRIFRGLKIHDSLSFDFPTRPYWPQWSHGGRPKALERNLNNAIKNATYEFEPIRQLVHRISRFESPELAVNYIDNLGDRFSGSQLLKETLLEISQLAGDEEATLQLILEEVERGSTNEDLYTEYVEIQVRNGEYEDAHRVGLMFPGFKDPSNFSRVTLSNTASGIGSVFFWRGIEKPAREFYSMAKDFGSGSGGEYQSAQRLASLDRNFEEAAAIALRRANRYRSAYAYRDYMCYLFSLGYSNEAWTAFNALLPAMGRAQIWAAGDVGHRIVGSSTQEVVSWLTSDAAKQAKNGLEPAAVIAAIRFFTTDRSFSEEQVTLISELAENHNTRTTLDSKYTVRFQPGDANSRSDEIIGPSFYQGHSERLYTGTSYTYLDYDPKPSPGEPRTRIDSEYRYFAKAYQHWNQGKLEDAAVVFEEMAKHYEIANPRTLWMLPYFASSIAATNNLSELKKYLEEFKHKERRFDWHLSMAAVSVGEGDRDAAIAHFDRALDSRPHTEERGMFAPYQWAEICEYYYRSTNDERFRDRLLDWARKVQKTIPFKAWPYLIEAQYTTNEAEKLEALARGIYLDRSSVRLRAFEDSIKSTAKSAVKLNEFTPSAVRGESNEA